MAWFIRFTRFADTHLVYEQESTKSCGIAAVMMACCRLNKWTTLQKGVHVEKEVYEKYTKAAMKLYGKQVPKGWKYDGSIYTYGDILERTLNQLGIGKWKWETLEKDKVAGAISKSVRGRDKPVIVRTNWNVDNGGHWVLIDKINSFLGDSYASVCDPWDGDVHITKFKKGTSFDYAASQPRLSWSLGDKKREYVGTADGKFRDEIIRWTGK